ncbi:unnamed protein product [Ceutorhynchus assimilis]|uniref:Chitin-binding type-2 domain-containing protein n=1 Tax=Ceutorhynchus assimilis TaxID=467358 RepID=A0A9N9MVS7_9CUCU|nr:unnamed protein product [Ceutorhynchus assimilis]
MKVSPKVIKRICLQTITENKQVRSHGSSPLPTPNRYRDLHQYPSVLPARYHELIKSTRKAIGMNRNTPTPSICAKVAKCHQQLLAVTAADDITTIHLGMVNTMMPILLRIWKTGGLMINRMMASLCPDIENSRKGSVMLNLLPMAFLQGEIAKPPSGNFDEFMTKFENSLQSSSSSKFAIITCGDFNINFLSTDHKARQLTDLVETYGFSRMIFLPTRGNACLDNIFINLPNAEAHTYDFNISDHLAVIVEFPFIIKPNIKINNKYQPYTRTGLSKFFNMVSNINWDFINCENISTEEKAKLVVLLLQNNINAAFPVVEMKNKKPVLNLTWFNDELREKRDLPNFVTDAADQQKCPILLDLKTPCPSNCTELVLIPDRICVKYWQCDNGVATELTCPKGLEFNPERKVCDWPEDAKCTKQGWCDEDLRCPSPTKPTSPSTTTRNPNAPPCPCDCTELVLIPSKNCGKYWQCDNEDATEKNCPKGLEFNPDRKVCDWPANASCTGQGWCAEDLICPIPTKPTKPPAPSTTTKNPRAPPCPCDCPELVLIPDKICGKYWQCDNEVATELSCPKGLEFNPVRKVCDWPENAKCSGLGWCDEDLKCPPATKPTTPTSTTKNPNAPPCPCDCKELVLIPSKNCGKYWQCDNEDATEINCPKGLEFNPDRKVCDWPANASCTGQGWCAEDLICPIPTKPTKPPAPSTTTKNPRAPPCPCDCTELVLIPDKICGKYWQCDNEVATELSCPKGLEFNPVRKVCDWPENAKSPCPCDCKELVLIPSKNCGKYWQCDNEDATEISCPKGLEFNPDRKVCDWPANASCTGQGWCAEDLICPIPTKPTKPPAPSTTTKNPRAPPCPCDCPELVLIPDKICGKYWQCDNEVATELSCPKGLEFNPVRKVCDWPENAKCSGLGWCDEDLKCPPATKPTTPSSTTKNPNAPPCPCDCEELVLIPSKNCGKYWQCDNEDATEINCPKGLEFNPDRKVCDWPANASCTGQGWCAEDLICPIPTKPTKPPAPSTTTENPRARKLVKKLNWFMFTECYISAPCPCDCPELVLIPDKICGKYWQCDNEVATELSCPKGLEFNPVRKVCDWPENAKCSGLGWCDEDLKCPPATKPTTPTSTTKNPNAPPCPCDCPELVLIPSKNCGKYWQCENEDATEKSCPKGLEFNPDRKVCDWPANASCTGQGWCAEDLVCPLPTKPTKPPTPSTTTKNPRAPPCPCNCSELVLIPDKNCGKYWQCDNEVATELSCPKGLQFNPVRKVCDWPEDAKCSGLGWCDEDLLCPPPTKPTSPSTTTKDPRAPPCPEDCCEPLLIPSRDCCNYWQCDNGEATEVRCPGGLQFNPISKVCDWPGTAGCTGNGWCNDDLRCPEDN